MVLKLVDTQVVYAKDFIRKYEISSTNVYYLSCCSSYWVVDPGNSDVSGVGL